MPPSIPQSMPMTVAILGASGVYARHLLPRLAADGHRLRALVRTPESAFTAKACGADLRTADIFDERGLSAALAGSDVVINLATSLPSPVKGGDFEQNDRVRREGVPILLRACAEAGVGKILQQSISFVHGGGGDAWADEDTFHAIPVDTIAGRAIAAALDMEACVRASHLDWLILRGGLFYGPGTGFDDDWFARAKAGKLQIPATGDDFVSLIHIADMARATAAAVTHWPSRQALIVSDNEPVRWRDLFSYIAAVAGAAAPPTGGPARMPSFRLANTRARERLSWTPHYSSYRAGLAR